MFLSKIRHHAVLILFIKLNYFFHRMHACSSIKCLKIFIQVRFELIMQNLKLGFAEFIEVWDVSRINNDRAKMLDDFDTVVKNPDDASIRTSHIPCNTDTSTFESISVQKLCIIG